MACSWAIAPVCAQDISQIAKSDPLIITGSIGTNNTYFHSSAGLGYMSPLSNSFFANLNFNIYGFSMPFSIYFSNDNLNFSYPQFSFNLSPSYKNFTAHIGQSSMPFSQYVLNMSFNGVGLEWRDKQFRASAFYGVLLPYELFAFAKNTGNQSYDIGDIHAHAQSFVQLALGHSRQIDDRLRVGAKMKLLFGVARADAEIKDLRADLSGPDKWTMTGQAMANVSMKGFTYKEEQKEYKVDGQGTYRRVNDVDVDGAGLGGFGMAFDFGATYKIDDDWTVSAALLDLGFIGWSNNMQAVNRQTNFEFNGFHDVAVKKEDAMGNPKDNSLESQGDRYADQIADFANLSSDGDKGSRSTGIGATMNFGCEYTLPAYRQLKFGFLSSTRINGKYSWTDARLSANVAPLSWLDGGMSFSVNSFTASMGWVINAHPKGFNFFIGMDHILGKTSKEFIPFSSNASLNLGMNVTF